MGTDATNVTDENESSSTYPASHGTHYEHDDREEALDPQAIAAYRRVIDYAAQVLTGTLGPRAALSAGEAIFAALARHDVREREAWTIVRVVAHHKTWDHDHDIWFCAFCGTNLSIGDDHLPDCLVTRARKLLSQEEVAP